MQRSPTDAELAILAVLWERGPATVRDVQDALGADRPTAYTTTLKLMQIMHDKGLLARDESARSHVYRALVARDETQRSLLASLAQKAFGGSTSALVLRALSTRETSQSELDEIRAMIDALEKGHER